MKLLTQEIGCNLHRYNYFLKQSHMYIYICSLKVIDKRFSYKNSFESLSIFHLNYIFTVIIRSFYLSKPSLINMIKINCFDNMTNTFTISTYSNQNQLNTKKKMFTVDIIDNSS